MSVLLLWLPTSRWPLEGSCVGKVAVIFFGLELSLKLGHALVPCLFLHQSMFMVISNKSENVLVICAPSLERILELRSIWSNSRSYVFSYFISRFCTMHHAPCCFCFNLVFLYYSWWILRMLCLINSAWPCSEFRQVKRYDAEFCHISDQQLFSAKKGCNCRVPTPSLVTALQLLYQYTMKQWIPYRSCLKLSRIIFGEGYYH